MIVAGTIQKLKITNVSCFFCDLTWEEHWFRCSFFNVGNIFPTPNQICFLVSTFTFVVTKFIAVIAMDPWFVIQSSMIKIFVSPPLVLRVPSFWLFTLFWAFWSWRLSSLRYSSSSSSSSYIPSTYASNYGGKRLKFVLQIFIISTEPIFMG